MASTHQSQQATVAKHVGKTNRASSAYPRKRAVVACQTGAQCISTPADFSAFDSASLAIIERLERLEQKLDSSVVQQALSPPLVVDTHELNAANDLVVEEESIGSSTGSCLALLPQNLDHVLAWPVFNDAISGVTLMPGSASSTRDRSGHVFDELDAATCNAWLDSFFSGVHIKNPILDESSTRRLVLRVCLDGVGWDAESCLALLICANGSLNRTFTSPSYQQSELAGSTPMALFTAAQKRMGSLLTSTGVAHAQTFFLSGVFLMSILRPSDAWRMFVQSLAACQTLDWSEGGTDDSGTTAEESLYWSCWKSEQEVRWELGISRFGRIEPPLQFPSLPAGCEGQNLRAWYFYLSEISLWRLETDARQEMMSLMESGRACRFDKLSEIGENALRQLGYWQESLAAPVRLSDDASEPDVLRFVLRGRITYLKELISWPFIHAFLMRNNESPIVRQWVLKGLAFHLERIEINKSGFYHRHHGTWLMARSSARSACILLAFANAPSASELMPEAWRPGVVSVLDMLCHWQNEAGGFERAILVLQQLLNST
ncbi:unnamed protein product [Clonostachys rosea]|uniref:Transcription factor domain-containing protein n=1 Tax=Bionectria ochroleuca TaxID=29856 RepID=A0ABY6U9P0_BIOOC|nr:unnamed protein product [Clonostachys rosea]